MMQRLGMSILGIWAVASSGAAPAAVAQGVPSPDTVVTLNEGIYYYVEGAQDRDMLDLAIERFTSVLGEEPRDTTAMLFRAMTHGRIALLLDGEKRTHENTVRVINAVLDVRAKPDGVDGVRADRAAAEAVLADGTSSLAERRVAGVRKTYCDDLLARVDRERGKANRELEDEQREAVRRSQAAARVEREHYVAMLDDLRRLVERIERPEVVVRLLEVVANAKVGRIDAEQARDVVRGHLAAGEASGPVDALREGEAERLRAAADILVALLSEPLEDRDRVRATFFLGVIRYRQGLPLRTETEAAALDETGLEMLREAERLMATLADDESTEDTWRSYAALYLGLILPVRATAETNIAVRNRMLDEALQRLGQSADLDARIGDPRSIIPDLVWRHRDSIAEARVARGAAAPRNDISLSLYAGTRYDTNVVLLGERTDLPRDVSRERDFGFTGGAALDYTLDIAERVTLGFQARTSQLGNVEIHEFDQQTYGGSVAVQYEAMPEGDRVGPIYLSLQYDFDYTLLGRSEFLESHALTPSVRVYAANQRAETDVYVTHQRRDYFEPLYDRRFNRDGDYVTAGVSQRFKLVEMTSLYQVRGWEPWGSPQDEALQQSDPDYPERYLTPFVGVRYGRDTTKGDEFDRRSTALAAGVEVPLPWGLQLDASGQWEWERYPKGSLVDFHRRQRRDMIQEYDVALSRTFVLRAGQQANRYTPAFDRLLMTLRAHVTWTGDDSNVVDRLGQAIFEYDRLVCGLNVAFSFN